MSAGTALLQVWVNDRAHPVSGPTALLSVLESLGLVARNGTAAAVNGEVVPRSAWASRVLEPGDRVLVIRATQGG